MQYCYTDTDIFHRGRLCEKISSFGREKTFRSCRSYCSLPNSEYKSVRTSTFSSKNLLFTTSNENINLSNNSNRSLLKNTKFLIIFPQSLCKSYEPIILLLQDHNVKMKMFTNNTKLSIFKDPNQNTKSQPKYSTRV